MNQRLNLERIARSLSLAFPDERHFLVTASRDGPGCHTFRISELTLNRIGLTALDELLRLADKVSDQLGAAERAVHSESLMREAPAVITARYAGGEQFTGYVSGSWERYLDHFIHACRIPLAEAQRRLSAMGGAEFLIVSASPEGLVIEENVNYRPSEWRSNG